MSSNIKAAIFWIVVLVLAGIAANVGGSRVAFGWALLAIVVLMGLGAIFSGIVRSRSRPRDTSRLTAYSPSAAEAIQSRTPLKGDSRAVVVKQPASNRTTTFSETIDPQTITLIAAFSADIRLDEGRPLAAVDGAPVGAFIAFAALNKELAAYLYEHKQLLKSISFVAGNLAQGSEIERIVDKLRSAMPHTDILSQTTIVNRLMGHSGGLFLFTCVPGTGHEREVTGPIVPWI